MGQTMTTDSSAPQVALSVRSLRKAYGGAVALADVSFDIHPGSIHALLGGNGSGKSTTIKILAGVVRADAGEIEVDGDRQAAESQSVADASRMGLRFVHQQNTAFADMTVAENLALGTGFETVAMGRIDWRRQREHARLVIEQLGLDVSPDTLMGSLGSARQMMVAIGRALQDIGGQPPRVLVLDEPTASLPKGEVELLLDFLKARAEAGQAIVLVTHRLGEVLRVADRATILRDGRVAKELERADMTHESLVEAIMGSQLNQLTKEERIEHLRQPMVEGARPPVLELVEQHGGVPVTVAEGECVGFAGLLGSGRSNLLRRIFGALPREGTLVVDGVLVPAGDTVGAMRAGVGYVPEDRLRDALFADLPIAQNLSITALSESSVGLGVVSGRRETSRARDLVRRYWVKADSVGQPIGSLSGGNQQKVVLARWMQRQPKVLLLDEPTQGVDVGARAEIHRLVRSACAEGLAVIVVSSEMEELVAMCDRAYVISRSTPVDELSGHELTEEGLNSRVLSKEAARS
jgi:ribose transport system ATP-binding protein